MDFPPASAPDLCPWPPVSQPSRERGESCSPSPSSGVQEQKTSDFRGGGDLRPMEGEDPRRERIRRPPDCCPWC